MLFLASAIRHDSCHTCFPREIQLNVLLIVRGKRTPCVITRTLGSKEKFVSTIKIFKIIIINYDI